MKITQKQILEVCAQVDNTIPNVNRGGCGVFAYVLGTYLEQFDNCKVRAKVATLWGTAKNLSGNIPDDKTSIRNWDKNGIDFNHVTLKVRLRCKKAFTIDSAGLYTQGYKLLRDSMPVIYLEPIVKVKMGWSTNFPRDQIITMVKIIDNYFRVIMPEVSSITLTGWELGVATNEELPPSMPKNAAQKIESYQDNRQIGAGIVIKLKQGLKFASGDSIAYPVNVKDAIALMRKVA